MDKKIRTLLIAILIGIAVLVGIMVLYPYPFFGPFENLPEGSSGNCGPEYRFKVDTKIDSTEAFLQFLKNHQYSGNLTSTYEPTISKLIPNRTSFDTKTQLSSPINLDLFRSEVTVSISKAIFSNEKIYTLVIKNQDFSDNWPWSLTIKMSENGYISIRYCAGV